MEGEPESRVMILLLIKSQENGTIAYLREFHAKKKIHQTCLWMANI